MINRDNELVSLDGWIEAVGCYIGWSTDYQIDLLERCFAKLQAGPKGTYIITDDGTGERIYTTRRILKTLIREVTDDQLKTTRTETTDHAGQLHQH